VQVRYKRRYASQTLKRKCDGDAWAKPTEATSTKAKRPRCARTEAKTLGDLIDLHLEAVTLSAYGGQICSPRQEAALAARGLLMVSPF
jgi:hypothetical protein